MSDFWPSCGFEYLSRNAQGRLVPGDGYWRLLLTRPELALVTESCLAERSLNEALQQAPSRPVSAHELAQIRDADARSNYTHYIAFRNALLVAGTLENWLLAIFRSGNITVPPLFIDGVVQAVLRGLLDGKRDAYQARAAELLFRAQRITTQDGHVIAGDRDTLDLQHETRGFGELGRLLAQAGAPLKTAQMLLLDADPDSGERYWARAMQPGTQSVFLLDLTHEMQRDIGHGLQFNLTMAHSGLKALAAVLQGWVEHLLGVKVNIRPVQRIDDAQWRWHIGLDAESNALLNDLYENRPVETERLARLISLFKLEFANPAEMRADVAGKPVYLGLMMNAERVLRLKPQNLLLNLPLAVSS